MYVYVHIYSQASQFGHCTADYACVLLFLRQFRHLSDRTPGRLQARIPFAFGVEPHPSPYFGHSY
jgi:hypothetical protein